MIRTAIALFAGLTILAAASLGAAHVARAGAQAQAAATLELREQRLQAELADWNRVAPSGIADAATGAEARRTLALLQEVYAQEQRLWAYYETLDAQRATRSQLASERLELERRVARHERELAQLDANLERLRPVDDATPGIDFTDATD